MRWINCGSRFHRQVSHGAQRAVGCAWGRRLSIVELLTKACRSSMPLGFVAFGSAPRHLFRG